MSQVPPGWMATTLGSVVALIGGSTPKGVLTASPGTIPFYKVADMNASDGYMMASARVTVTEETAVELSLRICPPGTVIFPKVGGALHTNKKRVLTRLAAFDTNTMAAVPTSAIDARFLYYWLSGIKLSDYAYGSPVPQVSRSRLSDERLILPPLQEQHRIVGAIEEQFSRVDAGAAALVRIRRNLKRMRGSVLQAAVTGRLVPQIEDAPAVRRLVSQLRHEASALGRRKTAIPATQYLGHVPNSWDVVALSDLAESIDYGTSEKTRADAEGIPILRMGNLGWGTINYDDLKFLPREDLDPRLMLRPGDLLFNRTNSAELVGKTAVFRGYSEDIAFASYLIRVRPLPSANLEWTNIVLNSSIGRQYVAAVRNQQVGQANVNGTKLAATPIPLPSAEEQSQIIKECERLFSVIEMLEDTAVVAAYRSDRLRSSILSTAFAGELVAQDCSDEPASELLKRIIAGRAPSNGPQSTRRRSRTVTT